jgi:arylsulfatase A-like enzyme
VGSKQLLDADGLPDPTITPTLSRLAQHAVLFNSMYSVFPGPVRSHVDMLTGGRTLTWGSVFKELSYPYEGPTLSRSLSAAGYDTALFSAQKLDFENMNGFYKRAGYDYYYDFGEADPDFQRQNTLQSWGAKEAPIVSLAVKWLDKRRDPSRPFFLQYLTVATHHPYTIPADYRGPARGSSRKENYLNALNYSDAALGLLIAQLKSRHLLDNTLIVINGDHGEAFGDYHAQNVLHKNAIYEENVKNFLLIANPVLFPDTVLSQRIASIGDIMPTLLGMADVPPADVPGQNIMSKAYTPRLVYFYKNTNPELWGLRDGEWKFIGAGLGGSAQLFDLKSDPDESYNVADIYPDHAALYDKLAARWYVDTNHDFVTRLKDFRYPGGKELRGSDLRTLGPKLLVFGYQQPEQRGSGEDFIELPSFNPFEKVVAWSRWVSYPEDKVIHYVWTSPSGEAHDLDFTVQSGWSSTWVNGDLPLPMEEGTWHLSLQDGKQTLLSGTFTVDGKTPLRIHRDTEARAQEYAVGKYVTNEFGKEKFSSTAKLNPTDHIVMWTRWKQLDHKRRITYRWKSPSGQTTEFYFDVNEGWDQTWVNLGNDQPVETGRWEVTLWEGEHRLGTTSFNVAPVGAP